MAPAALVAAMDRQHGAIVHASAPQIGKTVQKPGVARALGGIGNGRLRHRVQPAKPELLRFYHQSRILKRSFRMT